jgi:hypothetical protein
VADSASAVVEPRMVVRVPPSAGVSASEVGRLARGARRELAATLGTSAGPMTIEIYGSLDTFRHATGRPWWDSTVVDGSVVELAPVPVLAQRDGLEAAIRRGIAEALVADALSDRPAWVRVGAARYFARAAGSSTAADPPRVRCPADAELVLAVSAPAQRDAEQRAERCFARALTAAGDWRKVK